MRDGLAQPGIRQQVQESSAVTVLHSPRDSHDDSRVVRARPQIVTRTVAGGGAIGLAFSQGTFGAAGRHGIDLQRSTTTIHVFKSGLFRAFADNHLIQAPLAEGSIDGSAMPHVDLVIEAQRLHVLDPNLSRKDREQVQARMLGTEVPDATRLDDPPANGFCDPRSASLVER